MVRLFLFFKKIYFVFFFIVFEVIAFNIYSNSTDYSKSRTLSASTRVLGGLYSAAAQVKEYFGLRKENAVLFDKIAELENRLEAQRVLLDKDSVLSLPAGEAEYTYIPARVVNNSTTKQNNYITIDKGTRDGMEPDMALVTDRGIVGYVLHCDRNYSIAVSLLNRDFRTSGKLARDGFDGLVFWDGVDHDMMDMIEVSKYAEIVVGDTVTTTHLSSKFPPGHMIGTVDSFRLIDGAYYAIKVRLAETFGNLRYVMAVKFSDREQIEALQRQAAESENM